MIKKILVLLLGLSAFACAPKELDKSATTPEQAAESAPTVLTRQWQRVIRYDCNNQVTSDKMETVKSPIQNVSIKPFEYTNLYSSEFKNLTNGSSPSTLNLTDFVIDMAPSAFNMKVEEGINKIEYKFLYCDQTVVDAQGQTTCAKAPDVRESGTFFLNISYVQQNLDGFLELKPSPEECKPK
jgi:hypothetical protein